MVYDGFHCYFLYTCQVDCQGDLVVHFTMFYAQQAQLSTINMPLKCYHIKLYNKNCKKVDLLMRISAHLYSSTP